MSRQPAKRRPPSLSSRLNLGLYRAFLAAARCVRPVRPVRPALDAGGRVLVISTAGLGDTLVDSAAIRALKESFPDVEIELVVHHRRPDIGRHNPLVHRMHTLRKGPVGFIQLWSRLRRSGSWDAVFVMSSHDPEARTLAYLLSPDTSIGWGWRTQLPGVLAWELDSRELRRDHLVRQGLALAEVAGATAETPRMVYEVMEQDREALRHSLVRLGIDASPGLVFQLGGGGDAYRDWPVEHFLELARLATAAGMGPIFLLGGPDHRAKAERFAAGAAGMEYFDVAGKLPLPQSAALLEEATCVVSTDTGIMHLAFALGVPTVALLHCSPGDRRVGPIADRDRHVVIELPKPAGYVKPRDASMQAIPPGEVFAGLERLYRRGAG